MSTFLSYYGKTLGVLSLLSALTCFIGIFAWHLGGWGFMLACWFAMVGVFSLTFGAGLQLDEPGTEIAKAGSESAPLLAILATLAFALPQAFIWSGAVYRVSFLWGAAAPFALMLLNSLRRK